MKIELIEISKIDSIREPCVVYDLTVEDNHSYCVNNNIIVHNSVCETRKVTGCGYPQLSAIDECSHVVHGLKQQEKKLGLACSDGGCKTPGDVCKAFAAGADFVMLGGMFAGCDECNGDWTINKDMNKKSLKFYGMSSYEAQAEHGGGNKDYRASEGKSVQIPAKGPVDGVVKEILGGIRSCCTYIGATSIKDMPKCAEFIKVNRTHNTVFGV